MKKLENHFNCIYLLKCKTTGKIYIGQTVNFNKRMRQHAKESYESRKLYNAIHKYGFDDFTKEILIENVPTQEELNALEIRYIAEYDSIKNGYNIAAGGGGARGPDGHALNYGKGKYGPRDTPEYVRDYYYDYYKNPEHKIQLIEHQKARARKLKALKTNGGQMTLNQFDNSHTLYTTNEIKYLVYEFDKITANANNADKKTIENILYDELMIDRPPIMKLVRELKERASQIITIPES